MAVEIYCASALSVDSVGVGLLDPEPLLQSQLLNLLDEVVTHVKLDLVLFRGDRAHNGLGLLEVAGQSQTLHKRMEVF